MRKSTCMLMLAAMCSTLASAQVQIDIDVNNRGIEVSPTEYGIFFEDINHAADGGLYAELIRNRSFDEDLDKTDVEVPMAWSTVGQGTTLRLTQDNMLNDKQVHAGLLTLATPNSGVRNQGYWGMNVVAGQQYTFTLWTCVRSGKPGSLTAQLVSENGKVLGTTLIQTKLGKKWQKLTAQIVPTTDDPKGQFQLTFSGTGQVELDVVSLFPPTYKNQPNGCRPQLAEMLARMKPRFMRFPGGCYVEGSKSSDNSFRWERTVGPIEQRPGHMNANWGYWTTDGMGFHEFLQLAEDIGAKPLYVVNVGIWHGGVTPVEELGSTWIKECMDALEYANGDQTTKYGRMRAENGHPEPFNIEYLEIGNENNNDHLEDNSNMSDHYFDRYRRFYDAVKAKYPNMHCIGNVQAWGTEWPSWKSQEPVQLVDEHYYRNPSWFADAFTRYDEYDRQRPKVYVGEYAVTSQYGKVGNMNAALGEAVYMLGMERNSDMVKMSSYAPLFVNDNASNWPTDLIHYDASQAFGTPSYWTQQLFSTNIGNRLINSHIDWKLPLSELAAVKNPVQIGMSSWSTNATYRNPQLQVDGVDVALPAIQTWMPDGQKDWQTGDATVTNLGQMQEQKWICPVQIAPGHHYTYRVQARKNDGNEGFLMIFNYQNEKDFDWFNVGGWGNTVNNFEQSVDGGRVTLVEGQKYQVEKGKWYDLRIEAEGDSMAAYINDQLQLSAVHRSSEMRAVFHDVTMDEANSRLYIKVVNVGNTGTQGSVNLTNGTAASAEMVRLNSDNGTDENTMQYPLNIMPRPANIDVANSGKQLTFAVAPCSINIITVDLK